MKIALVHDYLTRFGGAERVLLALAEMWPEAPIFTSLVTDEVRDRFGPHRVRSQLRLPPQLLKVAVPILPWVFENLDVGGFDVVISSGYFAKAVLTTPEQLHLNYCHTVPRFLYGLPTETRLRSHWWGRLLTAPVDHRLKDWDFYSAQRPDLIVANSQTVAARVKKFWQRDATVIYPPVELSKGRTPEFLGSVPVPESYQLPASPALSMGGSAGGQTTNYFLVVSRLEPYKNVDLAIQVCNELHLPLKVVGSGSERRRLQRLAGPTVEISGSVADQELAELYAGCRAVIFPAQDEDFGIVPVEAMGYGKPVVALRSGGVTETVVENQTGVFFDQATVADLTTAMKGFLANEYFLSDVCRQACLDRAAKFAKETFQKEFRDLVEGQWRPRSSP